MQLAQRLGAFDQAAVGIHDAVAGVLPGHVLVAGGGAGGVFLEAVAVAVAVLVDPGEAAFGGGDMAVDEAAVAGGAPGGVQGHEVERGRVGGAVIGGVRDHLEMREFAVAEFVQDLAGFGVAVVVALLCLISAEDLKRAGGEAGIDDHGLQRDDQRVTAEQGDEPGQAGGGDEDHVVHAFERQAECGHVLHALVVGAVELLVAGLDLQHGALPFVHAALVVGGGDGEAAVAGGADAPVAVDQVVGEVAGPGLAGLHGDVEAEAAIGVDRGLAAAGHADDQAATEIPVAVDDAQLLARRRPDGLDAAAADDAVALDLEDVGEVGADGDFEIETDRVEAVVGDFEMLLHAAVDLAADDQAQHARGDRTVLGEEGAVGLEDAGGVIGDGAAVQQVPGLAIGIDRPGADEAGVAEIEAALAGGIDLAVRVADQDRLGLVDGDLGGAYLDFERHGCSGGKLEKAKVFFFEKKKQKTFTHRFARWIGHCAKHAESRMASSHWGFAGVQRKKVFCFFFSKKKPSCSCV